MRRVFLFFIVLMLTNVVFASDVLVLLNQMRFEGKVLKVRECEIVFSDMNGRRLNIPANDIQEVQFEDPDSQILKDYMSKADGQAEACLTGRMDAENYHGKTGMHVALGILFGPFAVLGAAVAKPTPSSGKDTMALSTNKEMFSDPAYLNCYTKKARGQNVSNTLIGWGAWILFLVLL